MLLHNIIVRLHVGARDEVTLTFTPQSTYVDCGTKTNGADLLAPLLSLRLR